ncbi:MAG TPA: hypothetical protein PK423_02890 [Clostridiales bacterium]|jgi:hypothetical protein|nr:hypothetical protein [Clostridiales bacterium]HPZ04962.1 hypothetical protein [Clostridiales bacterium]HQD31075.1 hypothetical protein [Clostridiales bacterium]
MLKKTLAVVLALCMMLAVLAACGVKRVDGTDGTEKDTAAVKRDDTAATKQDDTGDSKKGDAEARKNEIDEALDALEDFGIEVDDDLKDLLENIDVEDLEAAVSSGVEVTIDLADGWETEESQYSDFQARNEMSNIMVTSTRIPPGEKDAIEYTRKSLEITKGVFEQAEFSEVESIDIDGTKGARFHLDISILGMVQRQIFYHYFKDGLVIMVQGTYIQDEDADAEGAEIEKMMKSVKVKAK